MDRSNNKPATRIRPPSLSLQDKYGSKYTKQSPQDKERTRTFGERQFQWMNNLRRPNPSGRRRRRRHSLGNEQEPHTFSPTIPIGFNLETQLRLGEWKPNHHPPLPQDFPGVNPRAFSATGGKQVMQTTSEQGTRSTRRRTARPSAPKPTNLNHKFVMEENESLKKQVEQLTLQNKQYESRIQQLEQMMAAGGTTSKKTIPTTIAEEELKQPQPHQRFMMSSSSSSLSSSISSFADTLLGNRQKSYDKDNDDSEDLTTSRSSSGLASFGPMKNKPLFKKKPSERTTQRTMTTTMSSFENHQYNNHHNNIDNDDESEEGSLSSSIFHSPVKRRGQDEASLDQPMAQRLSSSRADDSLWSSTSKNNSDSEACSLYLRSNHTTVSSLADGSSFMASVNHPIGSSFANGSLLKGMKDFTDNNDDADDNSSALFNYTPY